MADGTIRLAMGVALLAGVARAELPLQRGFYVSAETPCGEASNATLMLLQRDGIGGSLDFCAFDAIAPETATRFRVVETCADFRDPSVSETFDRVYEIEGPAAFRAVRSDGWVLQARLCPQSSLPEPWRDVDISDVLQ